MMKIPTRRIVYIMLSMMVMGISCYFLLLNLNEELQLYLTPTEVITNAKVNTSMRIGGLVKIGSVHFNNKDISVTFDITDSKQTIPVIYTGLLPSLFKENKGVVAGGIYDGTTLHATEVLAKHDENYQPPMESIT